MLDILFKLYCSFTIFDSLILTVVGVAIYLIFLVVIYLLNKKL